MLYFLPSNLIALRKKNAHGQVVLAELLDVGKNTISNYENGVSTPDIEQIQKISEFYKITIDDLVKKDFSDEVILSMVMETQALYEIGINVIKAAEIRQAIGRLEKEIDVIKQKLG